MRKHKQPVIGVTMCLDEAGLVRKGADYSYIRREYGHEIRAAGGQPIFLEPSIDPDTAAYLCDGIVISGGEDIHPSFYDETTRIDTTLEPTSRTLWERKLIAACDKRGVHILGVCYGSQLLNVHYGGTLYQDIAAEYGSELHHGDSKSAALHELKFSKEFLGFPLGHTVPAAHRHHQAVHQLAEGFEAVAHAADGVIEAIAGRGHFGIQWHAESDGTAETIYGSFVAACSTPAAVPERVIS